MSAIVAFGPAAPAGATPNRITETTLAPGEFTPYEITAGPDGNMWLAVTSGTPGVSAMAQTFSQSINRITPSGDITKFSLPAESLPRTLVGGPDGNVWFGGWRQLGRITPSGEVTSFPAHLGYLGGDMTAGSDGNVWFTVANEEGASVPDQVGRITPDGQVTLFPLPHHEARPESITTDSAGNLWFTEAGGNEIGRITQGGQVKEFPLPVAAGYPHGIARGPEGNLWFTEGRAGASVIGRITPAGKITEYRLDPELDRPGGLTLGPDGRLWFVDGPTLIGRITPKGRVSRIKLPNQQISLMALAAGPEGHVWFTASGEPPLEGGGGTLMAHIYSEPGIVGRIMPGSLAVRVAAGVAKLSGREAGILLRCAAGQADDVCRGRVRISIEAGRTKSGQRTILASGRYSLPVDVRKKVGIRLTRRAAVLLQRHQRLSVRVTATADGARRAIRDVVLRGDQGH